MEDVNNVDKVNKRQNKPKKSNRSRSRSRGQRNEDVVPDSFVPIGRPYLKVFIKGATGENRRYLDYNLHFDVECGDEVAEINGERRGFEYILRGYASLGQADIAYNSFCLSTFNGKSLKVELLFEDPSKPVKKTKVKVV